jgi:hypothetical protein
MRALALALAASVTLGMAAAQDSPAPDETVPPVAPEQKLTAEIDTGYRFVQDIGGSNDVYRTVVNLGEGPKLFAARADYRDPQGRWLDRLILRANNWGGEPYTTGSLDAGLAGVYNFRLDYRNLAYFNALPSFANPLLAQGLLLSQRALDIRRRQFDAELNLLPDKRVSPFLAFAQGWGEGRGVTTFVTTGNEFPVLTLLRDSTRSYRGGVRLNVSRYNFTLEQGGTTFKDDQQVLTDDRNLGNRRIPLLGTTLILDNLRQAYGVRGEGVYNRGMIQGRPWSRLSFQGQFLYSQPSIEVRQTVQDQGQFVLLAAAAPYTMLLERSLGEAQRPRPSGAWSTEVQVHRRVRLVQSWFTDRFHVSGSSLLTQTFHTTPPVNLEERFFDLLVMNYNQHQVDAIVEVTSGVVIRGGHRYVWGDARTRAPSLAPPGTAFRPGELRRHVALAGAGLRLAGRLDINLDLEASPGDQVYFRTDLMDYQRGRVRGRYRVRPSLTVSGSFAVLNNRNPAPDVNLDLRSQQSSLSVMWAPNQGRRFSVLADYTRATLRSDLPFLESQTLTLDVSRYRDNGHHGSVWADVNLARGARLGWGGSYSLISGSRPTRYYQPQAQMLVPLAGKVSWTADWRWYGFTQKLYAFENFRTHTFATGLRLGL